MTHAPVGPEAAPPPGAGNDRIMPQTIRIPRVIRVGGYAGHADRDFEDDVPETKVMPYRTPPLPATETPTQPRPLDLDSRIMLPSPVQLTSSIGASIGSSIDRKLITAAVQQFSRSTESTPRTSRQASSGTSGDFGQVSVHNFTLDDGGQQLPGPQKVTSSSYHNASGRKFSVTHVVTTATAARRAVSEMHNQRESPAVPSLRHKRRVSTSAVTSAKVAPLGSPGPLSKQRVGSEPTTSPRPSEGSGGDSSKSPMVRRLESIFAAPRKPNTRVVIGKEFEENSFAKKYNPEPQVLAVAEKIGIDLDHHPNLVWIALKCYTDLLIPPSLPWMEILVTEEEHDDDLSVIPGNERALSHGLSDDGCGRFLPPKPSFQNRSLSQTTQSPRTLSPEAVNPVYKSLAHNVKVVTGVSLRDGEPVKVVFHNRETGEVQWEHPSIALHRAFYLRLLSRSAKTVRRAWFRRQTWKRIDALREYTFLILRRRRMARRRLQLWWRAVWGNIQLKKWRGVFFLIYHNVLTIQAAWRRAVVRKWYVPWRARRISAIIKLQQWWRDMLLFFKSQPFPRRHLADSLKGICLMILTNWAMRFPFALNELVSKQLVRASKERVIFSTITATTAAYKQHFPYNTFKLYRVFPVPFPQFSLTTRAGDLVTRESLLDGYVSVVVLLRPEWCPFSVAVVAKYIHEFKDSGLKVRFVFVCPADPANTQALYEAVMCFFPKLHRDWRCGRSPFVAEFLSDPDMTMAAKFGVLELISPVDCELYNEYGWRINVTEGGTLTPKLSILVLDRWGNIRTTIVSDPLGPPEPDAILHNTLQHLDVSYDVYGWRSGACVVTKMDEKTYTAKGSMKVKALVAENESPEDSFVWPPPPEVSRWELTAPNGLKHFTSREPNNARNLPRPTIPWPPAGPNHGGDHSAATASSPYWVS